MNKPDGLRSSVEPAGRAEEPSVPAQGRADQSRRTGPYKVMILFDGQLRSSVDILVHTRGAAARLRMLEHWGEPNFEFPVNNFALQGPGGTTLIDAGTGPGWSGTLGQSRASMRNEHLAPGDIDRVLLTHLHPDHARGLLDGDRAYFPRADVLVPAAELAFYTSDAAKGALPTPRRGSFPIVAGILRAYGDRVRPFLPGPVLPGLDTIALPGHTMGQTGFLLHGDGETVLFWADALHLAAAQAADPDIGTTFDYDPELASRTRWWLLDRCVRSGWLVAGSHVAGFARVQATADAYEIVPA